MKSKKCSKCSFTKFLSEFNNIARSKDGLRSQCRDCEIQYYRDRAKLPKEIREDGLKKLQ